MIIKKGYISGLIVSMMIVTSCYSKVNDPYLNKGILYKLCSFLPIALGKNTVVNSQNYSPILENPFNSDIKNGYGLIDPYKNCLLESQSEKRYDDFLDKYMKCLVFPFKDKSYYSIPLNEPITYLSNLYSKKQYDSLRSYIPSIWEYFHWIDSENTQENIEYFDLKYEYGTMKKIYRYFYCNDSNTYEEFNEAQARWTLDSLEELIAKDKYNNLPWTNKLVIQLSKFYYWITNLRSSSSFSYHSYFNGITTSEEHCKTKRH